MRIFFDEPGRTRLYGFGVLLVRRSHKDAENTAHLKKAISIRKLDVIGKINRLLRLNSFRGLKIL